MSENVLIAIIGVLGAIVGAVSTVALQILNECLKTRKQNKLEEPQLKMLKEMLSHPKHKWRSFDRLRHVIGADEATAKRLLLQAGARASEDGKPLWGLRSRNPLPGEANDS